MKGLIELRGVRVHNLRQVDLDLPHHQTIAICGVSGSGKTSLAIDTLYAEGQRRYIESFSAYTRQFLERLDKPDAERIDGLPVAIAVTQRDSGQAARATVGSVSEILDYVRLLFSRVAQLFCLSCGRLVERESPSSIGQFIGRLAPGTRFLVSCPLAEPERGWPEITASLRQAGLRRLIVGERLTDVDSISGETSPHSQTGPAHIVIDRLQAANVSSSRLQESLEAAIEQGQGRCHIWWDATVTGTDRSNNESIQTIDGKPWHRIGFSTTLSCPDCQLNFSDPDPRLFHERSPLGACPVCEGFGGILEIDMARVIPDDTKSLRAGAIAPWNTPAYAHELQELLALAPDYQIPTDIPYRELTEAQRAPIIGGVAERKFGGLHGFFRWLERRKYKLPVRVFLNRWRKRTPCTACGGKRLRAEGLAWQLAGKNFAEIVARPIDWLTPFFETLEVPLEQQRAARLIAPQIVARLSYLREVGLGYLSLDRSIRTLSGGERQRVSLTTALGSSLVNMLYVLDEPTVGLHPTDTRRMLPVISRLRARGNTVVVVEHDEEVLRNVDHVVEMGPGAGAQGGQVVFQGTPGQMEADQHSLTGAYLARRRGVAVPEQRRATGQGWIRISGARGHNLQNIAVEFPLGVLCLVTGVSGAGKSTLVMETLYPALCQRKRQEGPVALPFDECVGDGQFDEVVLVDQSAVARTPRSNPVTYVKAFDAIRAVFADTIDAKTHNYSASRFSFNVEGGRCEVCKGDGAQCIHMQFLPDVYQKCPECQGRRYRREILEVRYRGKNIADVLAMTVREAFSFFRGQSAVQTKLKPLLDVGLDYMPLGQPANTLSSGEAQRLKLAAYLGSSRRRRALFLLDEPTTGLHFNDIVQLLDCFDALLSVGHSLIVVEHNPQMMRACDYMVDMGPGPAEQGGRVVVSGSPEVVAACPTSVTGRYLQETLNPR